jgi:hypothetical protein
MQIRVGLLVDHAVELINEGMQIVCPIRAIVVVVNAVVICVKETGPDLVGDSRPGPENVSLEFSKNARRTAGSVMSASETSWSPPPTSSPTFVLRSATE